MHGVPQWQLSAVLSGASSAWGKWEGQPPSSSAIDRLIRELGGVADLWRAGIHPRELPQLAAAASVIEGPLPVNYYLGMVYADTDAQWLGDVVGARPDPDTAAWLACLDLPSDRGAAEIWQCWLRLGLPRADVQFAAEARLPSERISGIAGVIGWSESTTAKCVLRWAKAGCFPTLEQFQALARAGVEHVEPSRAAIDALIAEAEAERTFIRHPSFDRTELAVMLAVLGTRPAVLAALRRNTERLEELESYKTLIEKSQ